MHFKLNGFITGWGLNQEKPRKYAHAAHR